MDLTCHLQRFFPGNDAPIWWAREVDNPAKVIGVPHRFCMCTAKSYVYIHNIYIYKDVLQYDMIWYDMIWYGMVWYDMIWCGMIWYSIIWCKEKNYYKVK